jgi:hypothetical protein
VGTVLVKDGWETADHEPDHEEDDRSAAEKFGDDVADYWTWNWWQLLVVIGGGALILLAIGWCLYYRYRVVPRLIDEARREAYATRALAASTTVTIPDPSLPTPPPSLYTIPV